MSHSPGMHPRGALQRHKVRGAEGITDLVDDPVESCDEQLPTGLRIACCGPVRLVRESPEAPESDSVEYGVRKVLYELV